MAEVAIEIAGRSYPINCRDGDEEHIRDIARLVHDKVEQAVRSVGAADEARRLLLAALLLADELEEARRATPAAATAAADASTALTPDLAPVLERLAARVEDVAQHLEQAHANA